MASQDVILIAKDSKRAEIVTAVFEAAGYSVACATTSSEAHQSMFSRMDTGVAVVDYSVPPDEQLSIAAEIKELTPNLQIILLTHAARAGTMLKASNIGVFWILTEPFENEDLLYLVARGIIVFQLAQENDALRSALQSPLEAEELVAQSPVMQNLVRRIHKIAPLDPAVLLTGESGTGKTLIASLLHRHSDRHEGPFVAINCANLPRDLLESELFGYEKGAFTGANTARPGTIELASGGTLFLDELGEIPLDIQPKLLTFIQDKKVRRLGGKTTRTVDVRIICATNRNLEQAVREGRFREDLYYRVNVLHLMVPPLRERKEDLPILCAQILRRIAERTRSCAGCKISDSALNKLLEHSWPGNVRELEHTIERAVAFCEEATIKVKDLELFQGGLQMPSIGDRLVGHTLSEVEEILVRETFAQCQGNKEKAARMLGISLKTMYNKLHRLGIA